VPGAGPGGHTASVCTVDHAEAAYDGYLRLLEEPGPVLVGALPGASCLGPMYETACILDTDLRRRGVRGRVPITLVTPEPYLGHFGLGGVAESQAMLERELQAREIDWITNGRVSRVEPGQMQVQVCDALGAPVLERSLPFAFAVMLPAFTGVSAVADVEGLCDARGLVRVDAYQRSLAWPNIWAAGLCVSIPCADPTPVPTAAPATGYMIESMVRAIVHNLEAVLNDVEPDREAAWNAICLADLGDTGAALVALPQLAPRRLAWMKKGKWVHMAKIAFEKYFMHKMKRGTPEPVYEKYILKMLGIERFR
jgi:sulfide:quinone oxidoreductase